QKHGRRSDRSTNHHLRTGAKQAAPLGALNGIADRVVTEILAMPAMLRGNRYRAQSQPVSISTATAQEWVGRDLGILMAAGEAPALTSRLRFLEQARQLSRP